MNAPVDARQREQALDLGRSFCVQAPAGSGKTELLTQRLLKLLAHVEQPEEILAFTFTRKAAAEMRTRLFDSLHAAASPAAESGAQGRLIPLARAVLRHDARQGWGLLDNPHRLRINTIDSFTAWLSAQLPLGARLGARASITTNMDDIFRAAIADTLAQLDQAGPLGTALQHLLPHLQNNLGNIEQLLLALLHKREQWLDMALFLRSDPAHARRYMETTLQDLVATELRRTRELLAPFATELLQLLDFAAGNLAAEPEHELHALAATPALPPTEPASLESWRALVRFLLVGSLDGFRKPGGLRGAQGFPAQKEARDAAHREAIKQGKVRFGALCEALAYAGLLPQLQSVGLLPDPVYTDTQWDLLSALCVLLPELAARLDLAMQSASQVDHTETSLAALRALGDLEAPTDLALRMDYRIRHVLVDEFQDTSTLQYQLLEKLTAGWQQGDGRTLFVVGDGMQSCYAFRNAKVSLFLKLRNEGIGDLKPEPLDLAVNFRSDSSVVDWVNAVFSRSFPQVDDLARGGVRYSPSTARSAAALTPGVHCVLQVAGGSGATPPVTRRLLEAVTVADLCERLLREHAEQDIAILVRSRSHLDAIVPALRARGLRWNANKLDKLLSYPDINDLFTLLRALLSLADTTAWFALLRTPFFGLPLQDITVLAEHGQARGQSLWTTLRQSDGIDGLSADARARLRRCVPPLAAARERRQQLPLRLVLEALWIELGGPACLAGPGMLANVAAFLDLVEQHAPHGDLNDIHAFETELGKAYGSTTDPTLRLHLMTIHNAKGLEFDTVLLPGLDRKPRGNRRELLLWKEHLDATGHSRPLLGLVPEKGLDDAPLYRYLRDEARRRERLEATRLLYIGVTRAARAAWLFGYVDQSKDGYRATPNSLLETILPALLDDPAGCRLTWSTLPPVAAPPLEAEPRPEFTTQTLRRLPAQWCNPWPGQLLPLPQEVADDTQHEHLLQRRSGDLVHLGLKRLVEHGRGWLDQGGTPPLWTNTLAPLCAGKELDAALARVRAQLLACLDDPQLAWLFTGTLEQDACELALLDYSGDRRREHVIDRTFVHQGVRWIIDYKSGEPGATQSREAFMAEQAERYGAQLETYARLFRQAPHPVRKALLLSALPALLVLD